jgi:hypothetical protein
MGKKSAPPPAPDYTQAAERTAQSSQEAQTRADWANRPTINTPWGQQSWQAQAGTDPSTGQPITNWTQNLTLSPQQQAALNAQMALEQGRSELGQSFMGRVQDAYSKPFNWGGMQGYGQTPQAGGSEAWLTGGAGQGVQNKVAGSGQGIQSQLQGAGQGMMAGVDRSQLGAMPDTSQAARARIEDAMMARMQPQHQQAQAGLEGKLQNMGLTRGSEAWNREMQRLGDQQSRERFNALDRGLAEQQGQFGMDMQGRQQGWQEMLGQGQFQNQAQQQAFNQAAQAGQFGNAAQQQAWQQNLANAQFGNQAQQQGWQQALGQNQQNFAQQQAAQGQNFNQQMQAAQYQNQLRQQQIAEEQMRRGMSLNEMNALLSGQQVGMPQMPSFNTSQSAGGVNYSGAAGQQYNAAMDAFNVKQQQQQSMMSGLGSLAGMAGMFMSDVRLKSDIVRVGTHPVGVGIYEYEIFGRRERGVLAQELQEVRPDLVHVHDSGYLMVNYGGLQ